MRHPTDRITHTTAFVTPVVEHWLEREIAQWVHPMKDRSDDPSHHERTLYLWATSGSPQRMMSLRVLYPLFCIIPRRKHTLKQHIFKTVGNKKYCRNDEENKHNLKQLFLAHSLQFRVFVVSGYDHKDSAAIRVWHSACIHQFRMSREKVLTSRH